MLNSPHTRGYSHTQGFFMKFGKVPSTGENSGKSQSLSVQGPHTGIYFQTQSPPTQRKLWKLWASQYRAHTREIPKQKEAQGLSVHDIHTQVKFSKSPTQGSHTGEMMKFSKSPSTGLTHRENNENLKVPQHAHTHIHAWRIVKYLKVSPQSLTQGK